MAYRKLGVDNKHRRSMLANQTKNLINNESITFDKMVTYAKEGSLVSRRKILAFLQNDNVATKKVFELADRFANRNGGYTTMLKLSERRGDDALMVILKLVEEEKKEEPVKKETKKTKKEETKKED